MAATRVTDVLAEVFRTFGFDTTTDAHPEGMSRTMHELDLLAEKGGMDVAVEVHEDHEVDMTLVEEHARLTRDIGAFYGLLVTTGHATDAAYEAAARYKIILWDRPALEAVVGKAVLAEVQGVETDALPIAEVLAYGSRVAAPPDEHPADTTDLAAPAGDPTSSQSEVAEPVDGFPFGLLDPATEPTDAAPAEPRSPPTPAPAPTSTPTAPVVPPSGIVEGRGWVLETSSRSGPVASPHPGHPLHVPPARENSWEAPVTDPDPVYKAPEKRPNLATMAAHGGLSRIPKGNGPDPRSFNPPEGALLAPGISKEHAASTARERIYTIDHTHLRYHPKRVYQWEVECFVEGSVQTRTMSGTRIIDLATRDIEAPTDWTPSRSLREGTFDVPVDHKPVRIENDKAHALALDHILEETTREIVVEDHDTANDIMVTQKKRVRAHRDDVKIVDEGLHWCPVWCFTGVNGEVEVDALTGVITAETLRSATSNTMVL